MPSKALNNASTPSSSSRHDPTAPFLRSRQGRQVIGLCPGFVEKHPGRRRWKPIASTASAALTALCCGGARIRGPAEGGPHAGPREVAQLPRFDGPQRRWSRSSEDRHSVAVHWREPVRWSLLARTIRWSAICTQARLNALNGTTPGLTKKVLLPRAGHWIQQKRPPEVPDLMLEFLKQTSS